MNVLHIFRIADEPERRAAFDRVALGFTLMNLPVNHVNDHLGDEVWRLMRRIWEVVEDDYELRVMRDAFLDDLERSHHEGLKAILEWREYLKTKHELP